MSKPTPGPWTAFHKAKYDEWHVSVPSSRDPRALKLGLFPDGVPTNNPEADALLIAAAPDLYDFAAAHDAYMSEKFPDGPECGSLHPDARANWLRCRAALNRAERG